MTIFVLFTFFLLHNIRGTYSKYFQNNIIKLIAHPCLSDQLPYIPLEEFYIHSTYVIDLCIYSNFKVLLSKIVCNLLSKNLFFSTTTTTKNLFLKVNLLFMCKYFSLPWDYFCSEVIILILFVVTSIVASFLIDLFN